MSSSRDDDVYGGNYPKARRLAFARSSGRCQFCGLREAEEGHHWAFYNYPSGDKVQGHDLTALCKTCHELATTMRDWMARKGADIDFLRREIEQCNSFTEKREAISYWFYPEADDEKHKYDFEEKVYLDPMHWTNRQHMPFEEPDTLAAEPQIPTTKPVPPVQFKDSPLTFLFWVFLGPASLIMGMYLIYALNN